MTENKKYSSMAVFGSLIVGAILGFTGNAIFFADDLGNIGRIVRDTDAQYALVVDRNGKLNVTDENGKRAQTCKERERSNPCRADIVERDGKRIVVDRKTGEPLKPAFPVFDIYYGGYVGSHCPVICTRRGCRSYC